MRSLLARTRRAVLGSASLVLVVGWGAAVAAEDPPPDDPPPDDPSVYEECSATSASRDGDDKFEFDNCDGPCPEGGVCDDQSFDFGGETWIGCGCRLNSEPTLECCQILISEDGMDTKAHGACLECGFSGMCKKDTQRTGTFTVVHAACD